MRFGASSSFPRLRWWFQEIKARFVKPLYVLRLCRRGAEFIAIVTEARQGTRPWPTELVDRVVEYLLSGSDGGISVYASRIGDCFDIGHALGVIAEGITQKEFQQKERKRQSECIRGTFLIPTGALLKHARLRSTPRNNLNFFPADPLHYDLSSSNMRELAEHILDGMRSRDIQCTYLAKNGSYRIQAAIAYSYCVSWFGRLDETSPPPHWRNGAVLTAGAQIEVLKHIAGVSINETLLQ